MTEFFKTLYKQIDSRFQDSNIERKYKQYKEKGLQKRVDISLKLLLITGICLFIAERDHNSLLLVIISPLLILMNQKTHYFSLNFDIIMCLILGFAFSSNDSKVIDNNEYSPNNRCLIYAFSFFIISISTSTFWVKSTMGYGVSNLIITRRISHYKQEMASQYMPTLIITIITFGLSLYWVDLYERKFFRMYQNESKLKQKEGTILNLYPESIAIVNLQERKFEYCNLSFQNIFKLKGNENEIIERQDNDSIFEKVVQEEHYSIKVYFNNQSQQKQITEILRNQSIWDIIQLINNQPLDQVIQIRILSNEEQPNQVESRKTYYDAISKKTYINSDQIMIIFKNITNLKQIEKNKKFQKIRKIAYYQVTHEILTPVNTLTSFINILKQKLDHSSHEVKEMIDLCYSSTNKILRTVNLYTDFQKLQEGELIQNIKPFNIIKMIEDLYQSYRTETNIKKLNFNLNIESRILKRDGIIYNDKQRLIQIIQIVLENAIKFTTAGSITINMTSNKILDAAGNQKIIIEITDTGCGLDEEKNSSLFKIFHNINHSGKVNDGGAGIGLAFCKKMGQIISTSISFKSAKGQGTTVTLQVTDQKTLNNKIIQGRYDSLQRLKHEDLANSDHSKPKHHSDCFREKLSIALYPIDQQNFDDEEELKESDYDDLDHILSDIPSPLPELLKYSNNPGLKVISYDQFHKHKNQSFNDISEKEMIEENPRALDMDIPQNVIHVDYIQSKDILIVDDEVFSVYSLQLILKDFFKLESDFCYCGREAIESITRRSETNCPQYKLVFMDLNMPELTGLETLHILRSLQQENKISLNGTKVILYSCLSNTIDLQELKKEFDDVINKPIDIDNLREVLIKYNVIR